MSKRRKKSPVDAFLALPDAEKEALVAKLDREFIADESMPLTPAMRRLWQRAKRKRPGRPRIGKGAKRVLITVEAGLLKRADAFARQKGISRSQLISHGLQSVMRDKAKPRERAA